MDDDRWIRIGRQIIYCCAAAAVLTSQFTCPAHAQTTRVSVAIGGGAPVGGASGEQVAISADGRYVAFDSTATNLVADDTNGRRDVFVHDRFTQTTTRVSIATGAAQATGGDSGTLGVALSGDGRFVAFESAATNLVAGDTNGLSDVFVHDRQNGMTTRVSVATGGTEGQGAGAPTGRPTLTPDGRFVAFDSGVANLVASDTNTAPDVFVHDRVSGETTRVSVATGGSQVAGRSFGSVRASLSDDGRLVAFVSGAGGVVPGDSDSFIDAFVHDRDAGVTTMVSVRSGGAPTTGGDCFAASISANGRYVVFQSEASVVAPDTNGDSDIFVHDRTTLETTRVSVATGGAEANGMFGSIRSSISADGRYVVFASDATNLVPNDTNDAHDIFLHDRATGTTTRVSVSASNQQATGASGQPVVSANGRVVAFSSVAARLGAGDPDQLRDVFVRDTRAFEQRRISLKANGTESGRSATRPSISPNGQRVAFVTAEAGIVAGDTNGRNDVFVYDRVSAVTTRASIAGSGTDGGGGSGQPTLSEDGQLVAFESSASELVSDDTNGKPDVFVRDLVAGTTTRLSVSSVGSQANDASRLPVISANGQFVAFTSVATNLVDGDTNNRWDVFVHDRISRTTTRVSVADGGREAGGDARPARPSLSANGQLVAFASQAANLVSLDINGRADVFVHDRATQKTMRLDVPTSPLTGRNEGSRDPVVSGDGRFVSFAARLQPLWPPGLSVRRAVFVHDLATGLTARLATSAVRAEAPAISRDGRTIAFQGFLPVAPPGSKQQLFVHDRRTSATELASLSADGIAGGVSATAAMSADGRALAYESSARDLVPGDTNGVGDVFLRVAMPTVWSVTAREGPTTGGTTLQVLGEGFEANTTVTVGGVAAASVTFVDATRLDVTMPPHVEGFVDIDVVVPGFEVERLAWAFRYRPAME